MQSPTLRSTRLGLAIITILFSLHHRALAVGSPGYAAAKKEARRLIHTDAGYDFAMKFMAALDKEQATRKAMRTCMPGIPGRKTDIRCGIVFVVSAEGRISILRDSDHSVALCFVRSFKAPRYVPRPPRDNWPISWEFVFGP
jgi:hypothetical protein